MAFNFSGRAAVGAAASLEDLVTQALRDELLREQAENTRQDNIRADRRQSFDERRFASEESQNARLVAAAEEQARKAAERKAYEDTARSNMSELVTDPTQLAAFSLASGVDIPKGVEAVTKPKEKKYIKVSTPGKDGKPIARMVPEDDPEFAKGIPEYEKPDKPESGPREQRQWLLRDGKEVYDFYRAGDTRAPSQSNSNQGEQQQRTRDSITNLLDKLEGYSGRINTSTGGFEALLSGAVKQGQAAAGYNDDVSQYKQLLEGFMPMLARSVGHVGVLTQQDVDSVASLFAKATSTKGLAASNFREIRDILSRAGAINGALADPNRRDVTATMPDAGGAGQLDYDPRTKTFKPRR